jgi:hypothetical protein
MNEKEGFVKLKMPTYYIAKHSDEDLRAAVLAEREACAKECDKQIKSFLSPRYSTGQPWSTIKERFAAEQCAAAIRGRTE